MTASVSLPDAWPYRMRDLCRITGMPRQAIHFYIQQGLVPPGHKTGRNTARYGETHVERIRVVRQLQNERFMPLKAIRAVLDGKDDAFTPEQRTMLLDVKQRLSASLARAPQKALPLDARALLVQHGLERADLDDLLRAGVIQYLEEESTRLSLLPSGPADRLAILHSRQVIQSTLTGLYQEAGQPRAAQLAKTAADRLAQQRDALQAAWNYSPPL